MKRLQSECLKNAYSVLIQIAREGLMNKFGIQEQNIVIDKLDVAQIEIERSIKELEHALLRIAYVRQKIHDLPVEQDDD